MTPGPLYHQPVLGFAFGSLSGIEIIVIAMASLMVFGSRLPEVALRAVAHIMRARRAVSRMWRETGLEEELRRVRRDIELKMPRDADFDVRSGAASHGATNDARLAAERAREAAKRPAGAIAPAGDGASMDAGLDRREDGIDPDIERANEVRIEPAEGIVAKDDVRDLEPLEEPEAPLDSRAGHSDGPS